jgi:hypothetical protein
MDGPERGHRNRALGRVSSLENRASRPASRTTPMALVDQKSHEFKVRNEFLVAVGTLGLPPETSSSPEPAPSSKSRRTVYAVGIVVAVTAVALLLVLSGALSPGGGSTVSLASEHTAAATAAAFTNGLSGGPWQLTDALGFLGGGPVNDSQFLPHGLSCTVHNETLPTIPAIDRSASSYHGLAQAWVFDYANPGANTGLTVLVQNGGATELGQWSGSGCTPPAPLGASLIDSTAAADAVAATAAGSAYIAEHPVVNATFILAYTSYSDGGVRANATLWTLDFRVDYTGIPLTAEVFANNGTVVCTGAGSPYCPS